MKLLATILISLFLLASASAQTNQAGAASSPGTALTGSAQGSQAIKITRRGSQPSRQGPAENFTGSVRVDPLFQASAPARTSGSLVTFEPGARSAWHTHPLGQVLIVTEGTGRVQRWGDPVDEIRQGTWSGFRPARSTGTGPRRTVRWRTSPSPRRSTARLSNGWRRSAMHSTARRSALRGLRAPVTGSKQGRLKKPSATLPPS